eukprot:PITA_14762
MTHVYRLKKSLYGLKQAPRAWYKRIDSYLMKLGFTKNYVDPKLYFKVETDMPLILVLYVDDLFLTDADPFIYQYKRELTSKFEMKDLGLMHYFLGLEPWQKQGEIFLSQGKYSVKFLERCGMVEYKSVSTPMELNFKKLCGSVVGLELANLSEYRQLMGALMFLCGGQKEHIRILLLLGSASISWMSRKHKSVALSTVEAEYIAASMACYEVYWLKKLFNELFKHVLDTTIIYCDNQSGRHLSKNLVFHDHSKHIDIRYQFIRNMVQWGAIRLQHIRIDEKIIDILTKPLGKVKFLTFRERLGDVERCSHGGPA